MNSKTLAIAQLGVTTPHLIFVCKFNVSPFAEAQRVVKHKADYPGGVWPANFNDIVFTNLNTQVYIFQVYESSNGTALDTLLASFYEMVQGETTTTIEMLDIVVGAGRGTPFFDPNDGDTDYNNTDLAGITIAVNKAGFGFLSFQTPYNQIQNITAGGFKYVDGQTFLADERYTILKIKNTTQPVISGGGVSDVYAITPVSGDDWTYDPLVYNNYLLKARYTGNKANIIFPDLNTMNGQQFWIDTNGGNQVNVELKFNAGQGVDFDGATMQNFYLGKNEVISLFCKSGKLHILNDYHGYKNIGKKFWGDRADANELVLNSNSGSPLDGNVYKRIYWWITNKLNPALLVTLTDWETHTITFNYGAVGGEPTAYAPGTGNIAQTVYDYRGKFAVNATTKQFYIPNYIDMHIAAGTTPGDYKHHAVGPHKKQIDLDPLNSNNTSGFGKIGTGSQPPEGSFAALYSFWRTFNPASVGDEYTETRRIIQLPILSI